MFDEATATKTVDQMTPEELHEFFGVQPEGILKVTAEEWKADWSAGVTANADRWKKRTEGTKKDIIGLSIAAEGKYADKTKKAIDSGARAKALKQTSTAEVLAAVVATPASTYADGATKRAPKFGKRIDIQYPLREYAKQQIDKMPQDTDAQREKKMLAARRTNLAIGQFLGGIIDVGACRTAIDAATK